MKRLSAAAVILALFILCSCGFKHELYRCPPSVTSKVLLTQTPRPESVTITVRVDNDVKSMYGLADIYVRKNPYVTIEFCTGIIEGPSQISMNGAQVVLCARSETELDAHPEMKFYHVFTEGFEIIVSAKTCVKNLSTRQLKGILSGEITEWAEVGGTAGPVKLYPGIMRYCHSALEDMLGSNVPFLLSRRGGSDYGDMMEGGDPGLSFTWLHAQSPDGFESADKAAPVMTVSLDGVEPSKESILSGKYKFVRKYYMLTRGEPDAQTAAFIDFCLHDAEAKAYIESLRYICE